MSSPLRTPLILSLVVNLMLVGLIGGKFLMGPPLPPPPREPLDAIEEVAMQLPEEKATLLRGAMERAKEEMKEQKEEMKEARERTTEILTAEHFDADAYQQEVSHLHELRGAMMQRMADAIKETAAALTPQERTLLADTFRRYHGYWKKCKPPPREGEERH